MTPSGTLRLALVNWRLIRFDFFGPVDCQDRSRKEVILALVGNKVDLEAKTHSNVCVLCNFIHYFESWDNCSANLTLNSFWRWLWLSLHLRHLATRAIWQVIQVLILVSEFAKCNWAVFKTPFGWWLVQDYTNHYIGRCHNPLGESCSHPIINFLNEEPPECLLSSTFGKHRRQPRLEGSPWMTIILETNSCKTYIIYI